MVAKLENLVLVSLIFPRPSGLGKYNATSKISARIICQTNVFHEDLTPNSYRADKACNQAKTIFSHQRKTMNGSTAFLPVQFFPSARVFLKPD